jgi:GGDEF domain-containing protein
VRSAGVNSAQNVFVSSLHSVNELDSNKEKATNQAGIASEKIRKSLAASYLLKTKMDGVIEHQCTTSIGVLVFSNQNATPEEIFMRADATMYKEKGAGRNLVLFDKT